MNEFGDEHPQARAQHETLRRHPLLAPLNKAAPPCPGPALRVPLSRPRLGSRTL